MATTLPAINSPIAGKSVHDVPVRGLTMSPTDKVSAGRKRSKVGPPKVIVVRQMLNKKELELQQRRLASRGKLDPLTEWQTNEYHNTYKHTLCLDMLEHGFHRSFSELFELIKLQADRRQSAGPDSTLWNQRPLTEEPEKLDTMKQYLVEAEASMLLGDYLRVYQCHHQLAQYFQSTGDKWLADHFYANCLRYSTSVSGDQGKAAAEGHCNVGLGLEESGNYYEAANNYELFYALANGKSDWLSDDGRTTMHSRACNNLTRIYTRIANECVSTGDQESSLRYLSQAYEMSKEGGDRKLFGEASYQLGVAYSKNGDPETALVYLQSYLDTCQVLKDSEGIGKACEAIAKAHDSQGHTEESIRYLQNFISVSEESKDDKSLSHACNSLGIRLNCLGQYQQAFDNFTRSYGIARSLNDTPTLCLSRVLTGTAHAHRMLQNYTRHYQTPQIRQCTERLIDWKDNRGDEFDKPIEDKSRESTRSGTRPVATATQLVSENSTDSDASKIAEQDGTEEMEETKTDDKK